MPEDARAANRGPREEPGFGTRCCGKAVMTSPLPAVLTSST